MLNDFFIRKQIVKETFLDRITIGFKLTSLRLDRGKV